MKCEQKNRTSHERKTAHMLPPAPKISLGIYIWASCSLFAFLALVFFFCGDPRLSFVAGVAIDIGTSAGTLVCLVCLYWSEVHS